jgi:hypothetical protein
MADLTSNPKHAELERRSHNLHKVFNPTDADFKIVFNAAVSPEVWTIEANSEKIVPEYVCIKYLKKMSEKMTFLQSENKTKAENERRTSAGLQPMNLYDEQFRFESKSLKITQEEYVKMMGLLYRGLYQEYGLDSTPDVNPLVNTSSKPAFDSALEQIFSQTPENNEPETSPEPPEQTIKSDAVVLPSEKENNKNAELKVKIDEEIKKVSKKGTKK